MQKACVLERASIVRDTLMTMNDVQRKGKERKVWCTSRRNYSGKNTKAEMERFKGERLMDLKTKKKNRVKLLVVCQISIAGLVRLVTVPCFFGSAISSTYPYGRPSWFQVNISSNESSLGMIIESPSGYGLGEGDLSFDSHLLAL